MAFAAGDRPSCLRNERLRTHPLSHATEMLPFKLQISNCRQLCAVEVRGEAKKQTKCSKSSTSWRTTLLYLAFIRINEFNSKVSGRCTGYVSMYHVLNGTEEPNRNGKLKNRKSNRMKNDVFFLLLSSFISAKCRNKCVLRVRHYKVLTRACCCRYSKWTLTVKNNTHRRLLICISGIAYAAYWNRMENKRQTTRKNGERKR